MKNDVRVLENLITLACALEVLSGHKNARVLKRGVMNASYQPIAAQQAASISLKDTAFTGQSANQIDLIFRTMVDHDDRAAILVIDCFPSTKHASDALRAEVARLTERHPGKPLLVVLKNIAFPRLPAGMAPTQDNIDLHSSDTCFAKTLPLSVYLTLPSGTRAAIALTSEVGWLIENFRVNHSDRLIGASVADPDSLLARVEEWKIARGK